jgi:hypothetical protein
MRCVIVHNGVAVIVFTHGATNITVLVILPMLYRL